METVTMIPNSVTDMVQTFKGCSALKTVPMIPESVSIMQNTFEGCIVLKKQPIIPKSVTIGTDIFKGCIGLVNTEPDITEAAESDVSELDEGMDAIENMDAFDDEMIEVDEEELSGEEQEEESEEEEFEEEEFEEEEFELDEEFEEELQQMYQEAQFNDEVAKAAEELNKMIGLKTIKYEINKLTRMAKIQAERKRRNMPAAPMSYHLVFSGNPGTGKTAVARILGKIYKSMGILSKGHLVEADRSSLVAEYIGKTALKTKEMIEKAEGGILFIDEAYTLTSNDQNDFGQEAIDTLLKAMEDQREKFIVIVAGYPDKMRKFIDSNPGLESRFKNYITFPDYTAEELTEIFCQMCEEKRYTLNEDAGKLLRSAITAMVERKTENFANARAIRNLFEDMVQRQSMRLTEKKLLVEITDEELVEIRAEDIEQERAETDDPYKALNALIGLGKVKEEVQTLANMMKIQRKRMRAGKKAVPISNHLVFSGNPGTGKTVVARILAQIYKDIGVLSKGHLVEVDRASLVAGYVGQTAKLTQEKIREAYGGILFIDEAYTLISGDQNDFGQEAIDTLLKAMEDQRGNLIVIVAGYRDRMETFINSNPGLKSRFNKYIDFPDYNENELINIFYKLCRDYDYRVQCGAATIIDEAVYFMVEGKKENFANAREVRNLFERAVINQANRLEEERTLENEEITLEDMMLLTWEDFEGCNCSNQAGCLTFHEIEEEDITLLIEDINVQL